MAKVGLVISSVTPKPFAMPCDKCVFPVPKSPTNAIQRGCPLCLTHSPNNWPNCCVSSTV